MEPELRKNLSNAQVIQLLELVYEEVSDSIDQNYKSLATAIKNDDVPNLTYTCIARWIDSIDTKQINFTQDQVKDIIKQFGETPYPDNMELNSELMDNILNTYQYAGKMSYENIMNWVKNYDNKVQHLLDYSNISTLDMVTQCLNLFGQFPNENARALLNSIPDYSGEMCINEIHDYILLNGTRTMCAEKYQENVKCYNMSLSDLFKYVNKQPKPYRYQNLMLTSYERHGFRIRTKSLEEALKTDRGFTAFAKTSRAKEILKQDPEAWIDIKDVTFDYRGNYIKPEYIDEIIDWMVKDRDDNFIQITNAKLAEKYGNLDKQGKFHPSYHSTAGILIYIIKNTLHCYVYDLPWIAQHKIHRSIIHNKDYILYEVGYKETLKNLKNKIIVQLKTELVDFKLERYSKGCIYKISKHEMDEMMKIISEFRYTISNH